MPRPVHYLHHKYNLWRTNFGILFDFWDRLLGTYEVIEWKPERRPFEYGLRAFFDIGWFRRGGKVTPTSRRAIGAELSVTSERAASREPSSFLPAS
jgi:hypothetical protein